jgi:6-phosphogluconolactonase
MDSVKIPDAHDVIVHADIEELSEAVARRIARISTQAISERGVFRIALAGGETPRRCYEQLREMTIDWEHVQVYFGDERCLPDGDAHRNDSMANEVLLGHIAIPFGNVHAISAALGARAAAAEYASRIKHVLPFDLVLLGMGEDGHTASLFPGNPATERKEIVVPVFNAPKPPSERISLGLGTLNSAREKIFLVAGMAKRKALAKIARGITLPAARVVGAEWHIDRTALREDID